MKIKDLKSAFILLTVMSMFLSCQVEDLDGGNGEEDNVSKFLGTWNVSDQSARLNYKVIIQRDPVYAEQVYLQNFADAGGKAIGHVVNDMIIIGKQDVGSGFNVEGNGEYINSNQMIFEFVLDDGIDFDPRKATYTK